MIASRNIPSGVAARHSNGTSRAPTQVAALGTPASASEWTETLRDGNRVTIRTLHKADAALERDFIKRLSPESRRLRFLGGVGEPSDTMIRDLTDLDYQHKMAFVALVQEGGKPREIGVSRYSLAPDGKSCECAVTVSDEWQGKGLGTLLMRHLIDIAKQRGIESMFSIDAAGNSRMHELARDLGFARELDPDDPSQVIHRLAL
ncbi:MAG: GNAT family N-acetyltransferase [Proteobacteria bacterium]|nr:GNAT family N-acetyltransferase [Pseudomonadota bacterium]